MKARLWLRLGALVLLGIGLIAGGAVSQSPQQAETTTVTFENVCSEGTVLINEIVLTDGRNLDVTLQEITLEPGQTSALSKDLSFTPTRLGLGGTVDGQEFSFTIDPLPLNETFNPDQAQGCLEITVEAPGDGAEIPTERDKPIAEGDNLQTVVNTLQLNGIAEDKVEGSQSAPKIADVGSPSLVRGIPASSFQLLWVGSSAGQLRSAIAWDNPSVDLDLLVFGNAGACFQLNAPGNLAELCDRPAGPRHGPTGGPVAGNVFAVLVINWSSQTQSYTLSLSP